MKMDGNHSGKILLCDDHVLFCEGLSEIISKYFPKFEINVCYEIKEAEHLLATNEFQVFICDVFVKDGNGIELLARNRKSCQSTITIVLTGHFDAYIIGKAQRAGVDYFLKKEVELEILLSAIRGEYEGHLKKWEKPLLKGAQTVQLSKQEREILKLVRDGFLSKEIADKLYISKTTVDTHRRNIHRKLRTTSSNEILKMIYEGRIGL
ncbi:MAG: response regulator transcription factor [Bacteroidia bacterium]|nr:response regulator transcription factor [Bacteroidia bacterium]